MFVLKCVKHQQKSGSEKKLNIFDFFYKKGNNDRKN